MKREYYFEGSVTLSGVTFTVVADNEEEAKKKAEDGDYKCWDDTTAELTDVTLEAETCRE